jgi:hypothetical protein
VETEVSEASKTTTRASPWSLLALRHSPLLAESKQHTKTVLFTSRLDYRRFFNNKKKSGVFQIYKLQPSHIFSNYNIYYYSPSPSVHPKESCN